MARKNKNGLIIQHARETFSERWERKGNIDLLSPSQMDSRWQRGVKAPLKAAGWSVHHEQGAWGCLHPANDCGAETGQIQPLAEQESGAEPHPAFHS